MIANLLLAVVIPPATSMALRLAFRAPWLPAYFGWFCSSVYGTLYLVSQRQWIWALTAAVNAGLAVFLWRRSGRRRKRAPRAYGAKSKALLARLVRRVRETSVPRPVLRPVPEASAA